MGESATQLTFSRLAVENDANIAIVVPKSALQALLATPKPLLRRLTVENTAEIGAESVFEVLMGQIDTLETLSCDGSCPPLEMLQNFVAANPQLRYVRLQMPSSCCADSFYCPGINKPRRRSP